MAGDASCGEYATDLTEPEASGLSSLRSGGDGSVADGTRSTDFPEGWLSHLGAMRQNAGQNAADCGSPSLASTASADSLRTSNSVDGMVSRSSTRSTCSRDSIAPVVKETFGDLVDKLRTVEGRETTFQGWPHAENARLSPQAMARAGFLYAPDSEAADKVLPRQRALPVGVPLQARPSASQRVCVLRLECPRSRPRVSAFAALSVCVLGLECARLGASDARVAREWSGGVQE